MIATATAMACWVRMKRDTVMVASGYRRGRCRDGKSANHYRSGGHGAQQQNGDELEERTGHR